MAQVCHRRTGVNWPVFIYLLPYILSLLISGGVSFYAFRRGRVPGARNFAWLAFFESLWTLGYMMQLSSRSLESALFWNNVQFFGAVLSPLAYYRFGFAYSRRTFKRQNMANQIVLAAACALLLLIYTDGFHHLFRSNPQLVARYPFSRLLFQDGLLFQLYPLLGYPLLIAGSYALAHSYIASPRIYRLQIAAVLTGILIPWITTLVTWLDIIPLRLHDITPLTFAVSNLIVGWALFRYGLFDLVPIAYGTLVEQMEDSVLVLDRSMRILDMNPAARRILNLPMDQALGVSLLQKNPTFQILFAHPENRNPLAELELPVAGEKHSYEIRVTSLRDNHSTITGSLILLRDITDRKRANEKLEYLAKTDPLTGLYNRRHFFNVAEVELGEAARRQSPLCIILFDIDHFKAINDTAGHQVGDLVLQTLASRCKQPLRDRDLIARYGGEEFIILLPDSDSAQARQIGENLLSTISGEPVVANGKWVQITVSLGIASLDRNATTSIDQLVEQADQALYAAKQSGRNQLCVWSRDVFPDLPFLE
jgi:diguanylate cyclase (GGDEF)-like protein/PAS domain S-box-containing protein